MPNAEQYARQKRNAQRRADEQVRAVEAPCRMCGRPCDGTLLRCKPQTAAMLRREGPKHTQGWGIQLCHSCQRASQLAGSVVRRLLTLMEYALREKRGEELKRLTILLGRRSGFRLDPKTGKPVKKTHDEMLTMRRTNVWCPHCGGTSYYEIKTRDIRKCRSCGRQYSRTSGTLLRSRKLSLEKHQAIEARVKAGANATQIKHEFGVDYHTAWRLKQIYAGAAAL